MRDTGVNFDASQHYFVKNRPSPHDSTLSPSVGSCHAPDTHVIGPKVKFLKNDPKLLESAIVRIKS